MLLDEEKPCSHGKPISSSSPKTILHQGPQPLSLSQTVYNPKLALLFITTHFVNKNASKGGKGIGLSLVHATLVLPFCPQPPYKSLSLSHHHHQNSLSLPHPHTTHFPSL